MKKLIEPPTDKGGLMQYAKQIVSRVTRGPAAAASSAERETSDEDVNKLVSEVSNMNAEQLEELLEAFRGKPIGKWKGKSYSGDKMKRILDAAKDRRRDLKKG